MGCLDGKQFGQGRGWDRTRRVVPFPQNGLALRGGKNVEAADGLFGVLDRGLQQPDEPLRQGLDALSIKQVRTVVEPQLQALARDGHEGEGIMGGVMAGDVGQAQASLSPRTAAVHRIVLKHHQGVEQLA